MLDGHQLGPHSSKLRKHKRHSNRVPDVGKLLLVCLLSVLEALLLVALAKHLRNEAIP